MKNRNNRVFALLLAGTMMLGLAACGSAGSTEGSAVSSTAAAGEETKDTKESADGTKETTNAAGGTVRISEEEITLTVGGQKPSGLEDVNNLAAIEEYRTRLGIKLEPNFTETDWATQRTLLFAGNELPDLLFNAGMSVSDVNTYGPRDICWTLMSTVM